MILKKKYPQLLIYDITCSGVDVDIHIMPSVRLKYKLSDGTYILGDRIVYIMIIIKDLLHVIDGHPQFIISARLTFDPHGNHIHILSPQ